MLKPAIDWYPVTIIGINCHTQRHKQSRLAPTIKPLTETLKCVLMICRDKVQNKIYFWTLFFNFLFFLSQMYRWCDSSAYCSCRTSSSSDPPGAASRMIYLMKWWLILMEIDVTFHAPVSSPPPEDDDGASRLKTFFFFLSSSGDFTFVCL